MSKVNEVTLETINSGAVIDLFSEEFEKLLANVADNNTEADKVRAITIKVSVKPSKNRETAATRIEVRSSLAPIRPHESTIVFSSDGKRVSAFTLDTGKQQEFPEIEGNVKEFPNTAEGGK